MARDRNKVQELVEDLCKTAPATLVEQLKAKRAKVAREMTAKLKDLDRQIRLLEETDAEKVMSDSYDLLDS